MVYAMEIKPPHFRPELLKHLVHLPNLEQIQLSGTSVSGADLKALVQLPKLIAIGLNQTFISDQGIEVLTVDVAENHSGRRDASVFPSDGSVSTNTLIGHRQFFYLVVVLNRRVAERARLRRSPAGQEAQPSKRGGRSVCAGDMGTTCSGT